ncbi:MAG: hypothetical protein AM1032_000327 [Mycoplasmataceae bacterium]|nr:MAG: hypothetical protein AM1032_000327 [Mycoplasmataceae bacterium]
MINAQDYLDKTCPKEKRNEIFKLKIESKEGGFTNGINKIKKAFKAVFSFFSKKKKEEEKVSIDLNSNKKLEGSLDLSDFVNLEILKCSGNLLTNINVSDCKKVTLIDCSSNQLTHLDINNLTELKELNCSNNDIKSLDLNNNVNLENIYCQNNSLLNELKGLKKLRNLTSFNSDYHFLQEIGTSIDKAEELLSKYKSLMIDEVSSYQRILDSKDIFVQEDERNIAENDKRECEEIIIQVENLIIKLG